MPSLNFEVALEALDGLAGAIGASEQGRLNILRYDDERLLVLFDAFSTAHSLFRDERVEKEFLGAPRDIGGVPAGSLTSLLESGHLDYMRNARDYIVRFLNK